MTDQSSIIRGCLPIHRILQIHMGMGTDNSGGVGGGLVGRGGGSVVVDIGGFLVVVTMDIEIGWCRVRSWMSI